MVAAELTIVRAKQIRINVWYDRLYSQAAVAASS